jgi:hypothetical protein
VKRFIAVGAVLALIGVHAFVYKEQRDFEVFRLAGQRALDGQPLYVIDEADFAFRYAPICAWVFVPFALMPSSVARALWLLLSIAAVLRVLWIFARAEVVPVAILASPYIVVLLAFGQIDAVLIWLAAEGAWGISALFKPPFALVGAVKFSKVQAAILAVGLLISFRQFFSWLTLLSETTASRYCSMSNQGAFGIACQYFPERFTVPIALLLIAAVGGALIYYARDVQSRTAAAFYLTAFVTPLGWRANLLALIPCLAILVRRRARVLIVAALPVVLIYDVIGERAFYALLQWRFLGFVGLAVALATPIGSSAARDRTIASPP